MPSPAEHPGSDPIPCSDSSNLRPLAFRAFVVSATAVVVTGAALFVWAAFDVLLLLFAGLLFAVLLSGVTSVVASRTGVPYGWSFAAVLAALLLAGGLTAWWLLPGISSQIDELGRKLPESFQRVQTFFGRYEWSRAILDYAPTEREMVAKRSDILQRMTGVFSTALGALTSMIVVLFVGLFLAVDPGVYRRGFIHLVPLARRPRAQQVLNAVHDSLWWWLIAQFGAMAVVGVLTGVGLWALGVPLAFTLAIFAALMTFIPNIGPIISAIPALLLALLDGPSHAMWVFVVSQSVRFDSQVICPVSVSARGPSSACRRGLPCFRF